MTGQRFCLETYLVGLRRSLVSGIRTPCSEHFSESIILVATRVSTFAFVYRSGVKATS